jgi:DNA repair protein RadC
VTRSISVSSTREVPTEKTQAWHHPGGKLVELGSHALKQDELLAILIGSGVAGRSALSIANTILDNYVGLYGIHRQASIDDLAKIPGLGHRKAVRVLAAIELGRRLYKVNRQPKVASKTQEDLLSSLQQPPPLSQPEPQPQGPSDASLLAEIIGSGIRGRSPKTIADDLVARFGSFLDLYGQDMGDFLRVKGLNSVKVIRIVAAMEIAKRLAHALS